MYLINRNVKVCFVWALIVMHKKRVTNKKMYFKMRVEGGNTDTPNTHIYIYNRSLSWFGTSLSIKADRVKLVI
jgi:hypothetical protein